MAPDDERQQWALHPYVAVGPLRFGMTPNAVSAALGGAKTDERRCTTWGNTVIATECHRDVGVTLHYAEATRLACVMVDALDGPQVSAQGVELVGRTPSESEAWLTERAEEREPFTELFLMPSADPGSRTLGLVVGVQRVGDLVRTRPAFLAAEWSDDIYHRLPSAEWAIV